MGRWAASVVAALALVSLTACGPAASSGPAPASLVPAALPAACAEACARSASAVLGGGFSVALWQRTGAESSSPPLVELLDTSVAVQWWAAPVGYSVNSGLRCLSGTTPNCVLIVPAGAHAAVATLLLLEAGALVTPAHGTATFDSWPATAADLNGDGVLDVVGKSSDYTPDYAQGHLFWHTEVYRAGSGYVSTGCLPATEPVPSAPATGTCPAL